MKVGKGYGGNASLDETGIGSDTEWKLMDGRVMNIWRKDLEDKILDDVMRWVTTHRMD